MLGAVAAGALLGAARAQEPYKITLDPGSDAGDRADDEYKFVTAAGLEIVIGPKVLNEYDIASAVPSLNDNNLAVGIAVEGGDNPVTDVAGSCPGGITLDASTGDIFCYGVQRDAVPLETNEGGSITVANAENNVAEAAFGAWWDFANCPGDIDIDVINDEITCYAVDPDDATLRGDPIVKNAGGAVNGTINVSDPNGPQLPATPTDFDECPGGILFDKSVEQVFCYGLTSSDGGDDERDVNGEVVSVIQSASGGSLTVVPGTETNAAEAGFGAWWNFAICPGDIDIDVIADEITCYAVDLDDADGRGAALVKNSGDVDDVSIAVAGGTPDITPSNCPGGIALDESEEPTKIFCYGVERGAALVTNSVGGSIVVTETSNLDEALQEKTTIAGASATITVTGGDALASEGTNYKIELNTDDSAVATDPLITETVTVDDGEAVTNPLITETVTKLDGTVTETVTKPDGTVTETVTKPDGTVTETVKVTARSSTKDSIKALFVDIAALEDTITLPFADGTVIEIESKGADSGDLKVEVVTTELATTVTEYNIDYSTDEAGILGFIKEIKTDKPGSEDESVTTTFFLTGDDSLPDPDGGEIDVTAGKYLDLFEEELSSSPTVATYRNRLPAGGKLPESFKNGEEIKGEAILKFEIEGTSND